VIDSALMRTAALAACLIGSLAHGADTVVATTRGQLIRVGPTRDVRTIEDAARLARSGDVVEIDPGTYENPVASWKQDDLTIRGVGAVRPRLVASDGVSAEGKAIWVIKGSRVAIENLEFSGATVGDRNGAGIRHEGGTLTVRNCRFHHNQTGLLTWNNGESELVVESSEFDHNAITPENRSDISHQIYVGSIARFTLRSSYFHHGAVGHLVKTRAAENRIEFNRITDETGGRSSYEVEFPNGGVAYVVGNVIEQSATTENPVIVSFGAEGYRGTDNRLYLVNNTLVDHLGRRGRFLRVRAGGVVEAIDNLIIGGAGALENAGPGRYVGNHRVKSTDLADVRSYDYRLRQRSKLVRKAVDPDVVTGVPGLRPTREYRHPAGIASVPLSPYSPGALQSLAP